MTSFAEPTDLPSALNDADRKQQALDRATDLIRGELDGQLITKVDDDTVTLSGDGRRLLQLPQIPVISVASVVVQLGADRQTTLSEGVDYLVHGDGRLEHLGYGWPRGWDVVVTYSHGYAEVPRDLMRLTAQLADRILDGSLRVRSVQETIGDKQTSITYLQPASGQADPFDGADRKMLEKYRLSPLP